MSPDAARPPRPHGMKETLMNVCFRLSITVPNDDPGPGRMPRVDYANLQKLFDLPFVPPDGLQLVDPAEEKDITFKVERTAMCTGRPEPLLLSQLAPINLRSKARAKEFCEACKSHGWQAPGEAEESG